MVKVVKKVSEGYVKSAEMIRNIFPDAVVLDVTEDGLMGKFDPGFPLGRIKVPGMEDEVGLSLKGIWEGLKIFSKKDKVDRRWWRDESKLGRKRCFKSYGELSGIKIGDEIMDLKRGKEFFENIYESMVRERFVGDLEVIRKESMKRMVVLLDYGDGDERKWIGHAEILRKVIEESELNEKEVAA